MSSNKFDVIVVGGGMAGANAAYPLVMAGFKVAIIDGGISSPHKLEKDFQGSFEDIRINRKDQHNLFLGYNSQGLVIDKKDESHTLSITGGNRGHVTESTSKFLPLISKNIQILQSLAKGGLSETWGAACDILDEEELEAIGIPKESMDKNYQEVINRIGISGDSGEFKTQPATKIDNNAREILEAYKKKQFSKKFDFKIKKPLLALVTKKFKGRTPVSYRDLEYSINAGNSIYRARFTIEELEKKKNFSYISGRVVRKLSKNKKINLISTEAFNGKLENYYSKYVIMAAGSINTIRILLESLNLHQVKVPFITKPHFIIPCLNLRTLGYKGEKERHSLCQLVIDDKLKTKGLGRSYSQIYSYKSLMLYKLAGYSPFPMPETLSLLSIFTPSLILVDSRFPSFQNAQNNAFLIKNKDRSVLNVENLPSHLKFQEERTLKEIKKLLLSLGVIPLKVVATPLGSSAHYAGGVPNTRDESFPLRVNDQGELAQISNVYVADASTWSALPAKPPALTIMANANRIGKEVLKDLKKSR